MTTKKSSADRVAEKPVVNEQTVIRNLSLMSVVGNAFLSGFKIIAGIAGHSSAMISDAVHSFSDVLTTIIAYIGVRISKKSADKAHPYGHERIECIASLFLSLMLIATGIGIGFAGLKNIILASMNHLKFRELLHLSPLLYQLLEKRQCTGIQDIMRNLLILRLSWQMHGIIVQTHFLPLAL